jgi:hypothetical protein
MDKKIAGLLGVAAALTAVTAAQAAAPAAPNAAQAPTSYRDLLDPIPNALPLLKADDARLAQAGNIQTAETVIIKKKDHHHHHHHHHHHDHQD